MRLAITKLNKAISGNAEEARKLSFDLVISWLKKKEAEEEVEAVYVYKYIG